MWVLHEWWIPIELLSVGQHLEKRLKIMCEFVPSIKDKITGKKNMAKMILNWFFAINPLENIHVFCCTPWTIHSSSNPHCGRCRYWITKVSNNTKSNCGYGKKRFDNFRFSLYCWPQKWDSCSLTATAEAILKKLFQFYSLKSWVACCEKCYIMHEEHEIKK